MSNKNYVAGRNFEYRVKKYLEEKGYYVMRSAGSKSPFDLLAVSKLHVLLIQCKYGKSIDKKTKEKTIEWIKKTIGIPMVAWSKKYDSIHLVSPLLLKDNYMWVDLTTSV